MKAKTKFLKMYQKLPQEARLELVYNYSKDPYSLNVVANEIKSNTKRGKEILKKLGYYDDVEVDDATQNSFY